MNNQEIEVGMYIRTNDGYIKKAYAVNNTEVCTGTSNYYFNDIEKASFNINDLIEIGDYVNGLIVEEIRDNYIQKKPKKYDGNDYENWEDIERGRAIKVGKLFHWQFKDFGTATIVTHEQFDKIKFKVVQE